MAGRPLRNSTGQFAGSPYRAVSRRVTPKTKHPGARKSKIRASAHNAPRAMAAASKGGIQSRKL